MRSCFFFFGGSHAPSAPALERADWRRRHGCLGQSRGRRGWGSVVLRLSVCVSTLPSFFGGRHAPEHLLAFFPASLVPRRPPGKRASPVCMTRAAREAVAAAAEGVCGREERVKGLSACRPSCPHTLETAILGVKTNASSSVEDHPATPGKIAECWPKKYTNRHLGPDWLGRTSRATYHLRRIIYSFHALLFYPLRFALHHGVVGLYFTPFA